MDKLNFWRLNPYEFVVECFGVTPDPWQAKILKLFVANRRIALQAAKGPGKTALLAWLIWNFMLNENANIAAIAIDGNNLRDNLWKELAFWREKSGFLKAGYIQTATRIYAVARRDAITGMVTDYQETWFCSARSWSRTADEKTQALALAGLHSKYCMAVLDESGGMPDALMVAAEGVLANVIEGDGSRGHIVQAGNPTMLSGPLYRAATKERNLWLVECITGDPDDPNRSPRISKKWCLEQIQKYGRDDPWVLVNVFGRFPPSSFSALIGPDEIKAAIGRHLVAHQYEKAAKLSGNDIARFGDDLTVSWPRQGLAAFPPTVMRQRDTTEVAGKIASDAIEWDTDAIFVDATGGMGAGVIDALKLMGLQVLEVQFSGKPIDPKFYNKRAEIIWKLCEWIKSGGSLPPGEWSDMLLAELTVTNYLFRNDKIAIEEKEQVKAKLGRSPDYSDALACTFAFPVVSKERDPLAGIEGRGDYRHALTEYDPLERA